jgi:hypothetical protein
VATPLEPARYDQIRRADHPEWRRCERASECVAVNGPCGWPDVAARTAQSTYERWAKTRGDQINCDMPDESARVRPACVAGQCVDPDATPSPAWTRCDADADCAVAAVCDHATAVNKAALARPGFARWQWLITVDDWDRCELATGAHPAEGAHARCVAHACELGK